MLLCLQLVRPAWAQQVRLDTVQMQKSEEGLVLSATLDIELPTAVQSALRKGIPMVFVAQADLYRERWYWYDKAISTPYRQWRLSFNPLTQRWRLQSGQTAQDAHFSQTYDSLQAALAPMRRLHRLKLADLAELDADARYRVEFRFKLDLTQLPKPFQIGAIGADEWNIGVQRSLRYVHDTKPEASK